MRTSKPPSLSPRQIQWQQADARERKLKRRRERERLNYQAAKKKADGLADLPADVAVAIEASESKSSAAPAHTPAEDSAEDLVKRLTAIRERLFWLTTVYATTLSHDVAYEADNYRRIFRELGHRLNAIDREAYERLVSSKQASAHP